MKNFIFVFFLIISLSVQSAPETGGKVKYFYGNAGGLVMFSLDNQTEQCGHFRFSATPDSIMTKEWISLILMAKASDIYLKVGYVPNDQGKCGVSYIYFKSQ